MKQELTEKQRQIVCGWMNKPLPAFIYSLANPETSDIFYIGYTTNLSKRLAAHTNRLGFKPVMEVIEDITLQESEREAYWIEQFIAWGFNLTNLIFNPKTKYDTKGQIIKLQQ